MWVRLIGGLFLCYLGVRAFLAQPSEQEIATRKGGLLSAYGSVFFLTLLIIGMAFTQPGPTILPLEDLLSALAPLLVIICSVAIAWRREFIGGILLIVEGLFSFIPRDVILGLPSQLSILEDFSNFLEIFAIPWQ